MSQHEEFVFHGGVKRFRAMAMLNLQEIISACKAQYPDREGRGVNLVCVTNDWIPRGVWGPNHVLDPGRLLIAREQVRTAFIKTSDHIANQIEAAIDGYDPNTEVLFFIFMAGRNGGTVCSLGTIGFVSEETRATIILGTMSDCRRRGPPSPPPGPRLRLRLRLRRRRRGRVWIVPKPSSTRRPQWVPSQ